MNKTTCGIAADIAIAAAGYMERMAAHGLALTA